MAHHFLPKCSGDERMTQDKRGHRYDRNYIITHDWLGSWESSCDRCGTMTRGSLAAVFALLWKHRDCDREQS